jgi:transposase
VIQVSVVSEHGKELVDRSLTRRRFAEFLGTQKPSLVEFEWCASAHDWARVPVRHDHEARIIPAKAVAPFRRGHKTDSNDALAVAEATRRPNINDAPVSRCRSHDGRHDAAGSSMLEVLPADLVTMP